jgi:hypothetical protein
MDNAMLDSAIISFQERIRMAIEKLKTGRAVISNAGGHLQIIIPSRKNLFIIVFLFTWLVGWAYGEIGVARDLILKPPSAGERAFMILWLIFWTAAGFSAFLAWIWSIAGREVVTASHDVLKIERKVFNHGYAKEYSLEQAGKFRVFANPRMSSFSTIEFWGLGGGTIAFDYGMRTIKFANGLDEAEANHILDEMKKHNVIKF